MPLWIALVIGLIGLGSWAHPAAGARQADVPPELLTVAEKSSYTATALHAEVVELMDRLAPLSANATRLTMGTSGEGREIPLLVFADPPVASAAEARESGKLVVLLFGNIHAGEVCGKEALLMLARELATAPDHPLLQHLVIAIAPIYNADGNERVGPPEQNRPGQAGPEEGMGRRENAQGLDLNRDFIKLDAPETRAMVEFLREWDPHVVVDTHTTNGSLHRFLITYAGPKNPAGDEQVIEYAYQRMLPSITQSLRQRTGIETFVYGNFGDEHRKWTTFPAEGRYSTNYLGLRNRLGILSEAYAYAPFEQRVRGTLEFVREVLEFAQANHREINDLLSAADSRTARGSDAGPVALRNEPAPLEGEYVALGFEEHDQDGRRVAGEPRDYPVEVLEAFEPTLRVDRPAAYLVPASLEQVVENLQRHGVELHELREDRELEVGVYTLDEVTRSPRPFQGRTTVRLEATAKRATRRIEAGTYVVPTDQRLGSLAAYLLEPQSEDGLAAWGFFEGLEAGDDFPILRLEEDVELLTVPARPLPEDRATGKPITYQLLYESRQRPDFSGSPLGGFRWLDDDHYLLPQRGSLWRVEALTGNAQPFHDPDAMAEALTSEGVPERTARQIARRPGFRFNRDHTAALLEIQNDLYLYDFDSKSAVRLTSSEEPEELYELSPDGRFVSFIRENDLYLVEVETQTARALTEGGTTDLRNGKADWVYHEELYGRSWKLYWWSPDSSAIAFLQIDSSMVDSFTLTGDLEDPQTIEVERYPKPGTPNPQVRLGIVSIEEAEVQWADLDEYDPEDLLISGVGWWSDETPYFFAQDRRQRWLDLNTVSEDGSVRRLLRDETEAWVQPRGQPHRLEDGSFLLLSDRSGWRHIYRFDSDGELLGQVTDGEWDVRSLEHVDEESGWIYFSGTRDSYIASNFYRVRLDGQDLAHLTSEPGSHSVNLSPSARQFITSWSSREHPTRVALHSADGTRQRMLDTNPVYRIQEFVWGQETQLQIPTRDGFLMEATLVRPPGFDPGRSYPVWVTTYGGPYAPSVRDAWMGGRTWDQMLAHEGILVLRVDPRPASGKGAQSAWTAFRRLGIQEARDLEDAVLWLTAHDWADGSRVGLSGHSYGGYLTAFAMTQSQVFSAGIAGAPVTDWRDYDSIYTERYMGTPQDNPRGYDRSSVVKNAANLHGRLLLIHGAMDDNVHVQNTLRLVRALQDADRDFELMIYPTARHGVGGRHYNRLTWDFIRRSMGVDGEPSALSGESLAR